MLHQSVIVFVKLSAEHSFEFNNPNLNRLRDLFEKNEVLDIDNFSSKEVVQALDNVLENYSNKIIVFECEDMASPKALNSLLMRLKRESENQYYIIGKNAFLEKSFSPKTINDVSEIKLFT